MRQISFACQPSFEKYARVSRRGQFLNTMEAVVPWAELQKRIILSWLTSPSTMAYKPVAVAAPKLLKK